MQLLVQLLAQLVDLYALIKLLRRKIDYLLLECVEVGVDDPFPNFVKVDVRGLDFVIPIKHS